MTPSVLTRYPPFPRAASHAPSAPIPIPHVRRATDPPPRSPTRFQASSDLIFEMSPHITNETPLTVHTQPLSPNDCDTDLARKPSFPSLASRFGYTKGSTVNVQPYAEEPFLYSIPKLPGRFPMQHARTQSAVVYGTKRKNSMTKVEEEIASECSSPYKIKSLPSVDAHSVHCSDTSTLDHERDEILTGAFQQSFTSRSSSPRSSVCSSQVYYGHPASPPASIRAEKIVRSIRMPAILKKRSDLRAVAMPAPIHTSPAEPIVSFAQAELRRSPSSGIIARVVRASKLPSRARSPYPPSVRARRNSLLRTRSSKFSDDDLAGTLDSGLLSEKIGLERFLPAALTRRQPADENKYIEEAMERGRARSRTRTGRRL
jgi:hypothetical protein